MIRNQKLFIAWNRIKDGKGNWNWLATWFNNVLLKKKTPNMQWGNIFAIPMGYNARSLFLCYSHRLYARMQYICYIPIAYNAWRQYICYPQRQNVRRQYICYTYRLSCKEAVPLIYSIKDMESYSDRLPFSRENLTIIVALSCCLSIQTMQTYERLMLCVYVRTNVLPQHLRQGVANRLRTWKCYLVISVRYDSGFILSSAIDFFIVLR